MAPFFDPRRPLRLLHLDLLVLLGLGVSLFFFNRAEITASVALTYPVLGYFLIRMLVAGLWPRERDGPLVPLAPVRWLAIGVVVLAAGRIALNLVDSRVIDIGVAGVVGADRIADGEPLYEGAFSLGLDLHGDVYGPVNYLAYVPFELACPWDGVWDAGVGAAHAAAICFDLACVVGLVALGRRLRAGDEGRALGWALGVRLGRLPVDALRDERERQRRAGRGARDRRAAGAALGAGARGADRARARRRSSARRRWRRCSRPPTASGAGAARCCSRSPSSLVVAVVTLPFLPDGGLREIYDRTLGYQATRSSPFSVWGQAPSLDFAAAGGPGRSPSRSRSGSPSVPRTKDAAPDRGAGGGGDDRGPAHAPATGSTSTSSGSCRSCWSASFAERSERISRSASAARPSCGELTTISSPGFSQTRGLAGAADPGRRAGGDDVAGLERHQAREVGDELRDREDQPGGRVLLHPLAVEVERDLDRVVRPGLVGGDDRRAAGGRAVEDLARHPLRGRELQVAGGEVVEQRVAGEVVDRVGLGDVLGAAADDERDLGLVVDLLARRRQGSTVAPSARSALANLAKKVGLAGGSSRASAAWSA